MSENQKKSKEVQNKICFALKSINPNQQQQQMYEKLKEFIAVKHKVLEISGMIVKGSFDRKTGIIYVKADMEYVQKIRTVLHEYAHSIDFEKNPDETVCRNQRELVAESVAFIAALFLGFDTSRYSIEYIRSWLKHKEELEIIIDDVQKIISNIINDLAGSGDPVFSFLKGLIEEEALFMSKQDLKAFLESKIEGGELEKDSKEIKEQVKEMIPKNLMFDAKSEEFQPKTKPVSIARIKGIAVEEAKAFYDEMERFIETVLVAGVDYGMIPHCSKPSLLKPGAEKILNYLGLIARTEVTNRVEDYGIGFFSYEVKIYLIDYNGVVRGEGMGITNTKENQYARSSGYSVQNTVLKMAKKRALVDAVLNVGNLSGRFTQDVEDMDLKPEPCGSREIREQKGNIGKPATEKQMILLEKLMQESHSSAAALNRYVQKVYGINDYHKVSIRMASELIEKFEAAKQ